MVGRPSKATERRDQILDAMETCVRERGIVAASMRQIADQAGLSMQMVSHYFGNREELVLAFVRRVTEGILGAVDLKLEGTDDRRRLDWLVNFMFSAQYKALPGNDVIGREIWALAERDPKVRKIIRDGYRLAIKRFVAELERSYPDSTPERRRFVAFGLVSLMEAGEFLAGIGLTTNKMDEARGAADLLLESLQA